MIYIYIYIYICLYVIYMYVLRMEVNIIIHQQLQWIPRFPSSILDKVLLGRIRIGFNYSALPAWTPSDQAHP